jgi:ArsR family transcriptional regulator
MPESIGKFIHGNHLSVASAVMRAITHPLRLKILKVIHQNEPINVHKIYTELQIEQSITSQHLRVLREADLVLTTRQGKFIYYSVNYKKLKTLSNSIREFLAK